MAASAPLFLPPACRFARRNGDRLSNSERQLWEESGGGWGLWAATGLLFAYICLLAWQVWQPLQSQCQTVVYATPMRNTPLLLLL